MITLSWRYSINKSEKEKPRELLRVGKCNKKAINKQNNSVIGLSRGALKSN